MKIIDLLNKISNDEEVPDYVEYYDMLHDRVTTMMVCKENIFYKLDQLEIQLNSRVEPIEVKKIPEKIKIDDENRIQAISTGNFVYKINQPTKNIILKLNEIIDYLKSKEE